MKSTLTAWFDPALLREELHFNLTNRIPRRTVTRFMGWFSKIEQPLVRDVSLVAWRLFADLELQDAARSQFKSVHDCFTRELKPGARPIDAAADMLVSPCDGIVGGHGRIQRGSLVQAKGQRYTVSELLLDPELARLYDAGTYVTLRLSSSMYHRFHAPHDCVVEHVTYVAGDAFNTHPFTLQRVPKLYCKNERAIVRARLLTTGHLITLVPVAAILVASIRLRFLDVTLHLAYPGPNQIPCRAQLAKGQEMGWFEHGSTIVIFAPSGFRLAEGVEQGHRVDMGQALLELPANG